jgi:5-methylcytosine-specific restriction endonuclease McrA
MKASVRRFVRRRASQRCEYCRLHESDQPFLSFHIEHIIARKHHGGDSPNNLAWACLECNLGKSSNLSGRDTITGRTVVLFNPRRQRWKRHFSWQGAACRPDALRPRNGRRPQYQ